MVLLKSLLPVVSHLHGWSSTSNPRFVSRMRRAACDARRHQTLSERLRSALLCAVLVQRPRRMSCYHSLACRACSASCGASPRTFTINPSRPVCCPCHPPSISATPAATAGSLAHFVVESAAELRGSPCGLGETLEGLGLVPQASVAPPQARRFYATPGPSHGDVHAHPASPQA